MSGALHLHCRTADQNKLDIRVEQGAKSFLEFHFFDR
jgi:hypothetical protein